MLDTLNIIYSSDDNYCQHLGCSLYSLLDHNQEFTKINIFIVSNGISQENHHKLNVVADHFRNTSLYFIDFSIWLNHLKLDMAWNISLSSYARLFVSSMLPKDIERVIYLDCDMIIESSLNYLWNINLNGFIIGAVQDCMSFRFKEPVGLDRYDQYFNAGMLLIDLNEWRKQKIEKKCLDFINNRNGRVIHHDQGVLNGILKDKWLRLPLEYNLMTIHYVFSLDKIKKYFGDRATFYSKEEIDKAKEHPVILHFTPSFTTRPWVKGCVHPLKNKYWDILNKTPWKGTKTSSDNRKWYVKLIEWRYRVFRF